MMTPFTYGLMGTPTQYAYNRMRIPFYNNAERLIIQPDGELVWSYSKYKEVTYYYFRTLNKIGCKIIIENDFECLNISFSIGGNGHRSDGPSDIRTGQNRRTWITYVRKNMRLYETSPTGFYRLFRVKDTNMPSTFCLHPINRRFVQVLKWECSGFLNGSTSYTCNYRRDGPSVIEARK